MKTVVAGRKIYCGSMVGIGPDGKLRPAVGGIADCIGKAIEDIEIGELCVLDLKTGHIAPANWTK